MNQGAPLRLATRGSPQARTQAESVLHALAGRGVHAELVIVETTGDRRQDVPLHVIGGQGVFVKEIQTAVLDGRADVAVHSAKDLPSLAHPELVIGAFTRRRDPADVLVGRRLDELAPGATVASGSVRRRAQLAAVRPDLHFVELRGNIARRLAQVPGEGAIVMAAAALQILGLADRLAERLDPTVFVPAVGQGCVALEAAPGSSALEVLASIDDLATRHAVEVERSFLAQLGSGCSLPVGAHVHDGVLHAFLAATEAPPAGAPARVERAVITLDGVDDMAIARATAARLLAATGA
ncbi:MAG: hydroxymethylbilane synthase [Desertimonas sp.]